MPTKRNPSDFVTRGDRTVEALIARVLRERFPDHGILAEEGTSHAGAEYRWIIDPIDRTTSFFQGVPLFAVSRTRIAPGAGGRGHFTIRPKDELSGAERGGGAFLRRREHQETVRRLLRADRQRLGGRHINHAARHANRALTILIDGDPQIPRGLTIGVRDRSRLVARVRLVKTLRGGFDEVQFPSIAGFRLLQAKIKTECHYGGGDVV